jgi:hypothetical protein
MQRRKLLTVGIGASLLLVAAGGGIAVLTRGTAEGRLTAAGARVFSAVATAVLDQSLPAAQVERQYQLSALLGRLDALVAALPQQTQRELSHMLALLASAPGRLMVTGLAVDWGEADPSAIQRSLQHMRLSRFSLRQQVYHALRDLTNAAYYAEPTSWPLMGYSGPLAI